MVLTYPWLSGLFSRRVDPGSIQTLAEKRTSRSLGRQFGIRKTIGGAQPQRAAQPITLLPRRLVSELAEARKLRSGSPPALFGPATHPRCGPALPSRGHYACVRGADFSSPNVLLRGQEAASAAARTRASRCRRHRMERRGSGAQPLRSRQRRRCRLHPTLILALETSGGYAQ